MKAKKLSKKSVVAALSLVAVASTLGSVAGTVAWYQYSTMSTAAINGVNAGVSTNLKIAVGEVTESTSWKSDLQISDIQNYLKTKQQNVSDLKPITTGAFTKDAALDTSNLYSHPVYQHFKYANWEKATASDYITFPISLKIDDSRKTDETIGNRDVFLQDLKFAKGTGDTNITDAVRVHFSCGNTNMLLSKNGGSINTFGTLDLNNDQTLDYEAGTYEFDTNKTAVVYGTQDSTQEAYKLDNVKATDTAGVLTGGTALGTITSRGTLTITVTVFLEGWQELGTEGHKSSIWDKDTINNTFNLGMTFAVSTQDNPTQATE